MARQMVKRRWIILPLVLVLVTLSAYFVSAEQQCNGLYGTGKQRVVLATGSPGELGLVKVLAESFSKTEDATLCWKKAGSGASLKLLKEKKVDLVMVHAPAAEKQAVKDGWAINRTLIGSNEFFVVGPIDDPAGIASAKSVVEAYSKIAAARAKFFSRGDNSGTHKKEMAVWGKAGVKPKGAWYIVTKDFMTATLKRADAEKGYFMTDSSTWYVEKKNVPNLKILFRGDRFIINVYHALCQPPGATPGAGLASKCIEFLASDQGQQIIGAYGKAAYGEALYNDAAYARQFE